MPYTEFLALISGARAVFSDGGAMTAADATSRGAEAAAASGGGPLDVLAEPGVLFFAGGLAVLLVIVAVWYVRRQ